MLKKENLVTVYSAADSAEGHLLKNLLVAGGVSACVTEENDPLANLTCVGCHVLVPETAVGQAREIVREYQDNLIARGEGPDWVCEDCGAVVCGAQLECGKCGASRPGFEEEGEEPL